MESYRDLIVWNRAMELAREAYQVTQMLPGYERYALSDQIRRSAVSIPSNIAEGYGRNSTREYVRFLSIARGSRYELETQILLSVRLGYISEHDVSNLMQLSVEVGKMLNTMIAKLGE